MRLEPKNLIQDPKTLSSLLFCEKSLFINNRAFPRKELLLAFQLLIEKILLIVGHKIMRGYKHSMKRFALLNILMNILLYSSNGYPVSFSKAYGHYSNHAFYGQNYYTRTIYLDIINCLKDHNLVKVRNGFYSRNGGTSYTSRLIPTVQLLDLLSKSGFNDLLNSIEYEFVVDYNGKLCFVDTLSNPVRNEWPDKIRVQMKTSDQAGKQLLKYKPSVKAEAYSQFMNEYNEFMDKISLILPTKEVTIPGNLSQTNWGQSITRYFIDHGLKLEARKEKCASLLTEGMSQGLVSSVGQQHDNQANSLLQHLSRTLSSSTSNVESGHEEIDFYITSTNSCNLLICNELEKRLYRVFNNVKLTMGGRFYGAGYQRLDSEQRASLILDGKPVVELDYSSLHPRMLYHLEGIDLQNDPYDLYSGNLILRQAVKLMLNLAINSPTKKSAVSAFNAKVFHLCENTERHRYYPKNEQKAAKKLAVYEQIKNHILENNIKAAQILDKILYSHSQINKYIGSGKGIELQTLDSQIAERVLKHFTSQGIPCLCVHDSFLVPTEYESELKATMHDAYMQEMGFSCNITKK